ncbi:MULTISPECIES: pantoate--beta-alanine ligase [unclassified Colwellia]|uniref:pantoate--beta-alanine ligase n=1 Tax=unclassified Colwellia TaxID=196834 RepID=UPI0015F3CA45|nr:MULTISPECIES: pantoate--beta-alanine ligase [unclassified Colwellia]MBA6232153.1 pantoate--beta-alanine ligase [Colwellia sp. MB02u-7]MBA6237149.1 pantoate--beta-alanine ligase [Colwellia sp. MB02u-11]MBA6257419.1 pantoate--beta-alanine ligase [Colwellia sp. MB3u-28]MBA6260491.1 pantoate--beta-alanine ligase [Colwellia sp. MB3u-41]MBA6301587.1 pantoate--beta-alanine ligase [Colwellia sp. MB3u-22]
MKIVSEINVLRQRISEWRQQGLTIAFVPTMGNLHAGHISLITEAHQHADKVVASIFVNPMQFGANEDIENYPRTLDNDRQQLVSAHTDLLFIPSAKLIYPQGLDKQTYVEVPNVSVGYCGESRPGHFRGVSTVVCKLFNLVQPDVACFGLKDYQQVQVIQTMVEDLSMPIKIIPVRTVREASGLAMSSRNGYLTAEERKIAPALAQNIQWLAQQIKSNNDFVGLAKQATQFINNAGMKTDYIHICHARTLQPASEDDKELVILAAAHCGNARLIDNLRVYL